MNLPAHDALERWLAAVGPGDAFLALASLLPDAAIFAVDANREIVHWSPGAERLLGFPTRDALGNHCLRSIRCSDCLGQCGIARWGHVRDVPQTLHRDDGTPVRIRKTARAFFDAAGDFLGGVELLVPADDLRADPGPTAIAQSFHGIIWRDPAMDAVVETIRLVAATDSTVLIRGESGTGKELVAHAIHAESARRDGPFIAVNCGAFTPALLESELFGHVRGAFTGAVESREGIFARAHRGTLFLDEIAELPLDLQARLLRVLQERAFTPVGGNRERKVDVRIVAATNRSLRDEVARGRFREDLMYRLRVVPIFLPALRDRRRDIEPLSRAFIDGLNGRTRVVTTIEPDTLRALLDYRWPGNVRELRNVIEYAFAVGRGPTLQCADLPPELRRAAIPDDSPTGAPPSEPAPSHGPDSNRTQAPPTPHPGASVLRPMSASTASTASPEATPPTSPPTSPPTPPTRPLVRSRQPPAPDVLRAALDDAGGDVGRAAAALGVSRATFWRWRKMADRA